MATPAIVLPISVVEEMLSTTEGCIKRLQGAELDGKECNQAQVMAEMLKASLEAIPRRMTVQKVMEMLSLPSISQEQHDRAQEWLFDPCNDIPARTVNQTLGCLRSKIKR